MRRWSSRREDTSQHEPATAHTRTGTAAQPHPHARGAPAGDLAAEISLEERTCALAASAYVAARFEPSAGDPVGELSLSEWLGQKNIALPIERPLPFSALRIYGWNLFRGCPDVLSTPPGRLSVSASPAAVRPGTAWDVSGMAPVGLSPRLTRVQRRRW